MSILSSSRPYYRAGHSCDLQSFKNLVQKIFYCIKIFQDAVHQTNYMNVKDILSHDVEVEFHIFHPQTIYTSSVPWTPSRRALFWIYWTNSSEVLMTHANQLVSVKCKLVAVRCEVDIISLISVTRCHGDSPPLHLLPGSALNTNSYSYQRVSMPISALYEASCT